MVGAGGASGLVGGYLRPGAGGVRAGGAADLAAAAGAARARARPRRSRSSTPGWRASDGAPRAARSGGASSARRCRREAAIDHCWRVMWDLVRGATQLKQPTPAELARRYTEMLAENLGQPGFRELLIAVHDVDAHRDLVFALVGESAPARSDPPADQRRRRGAARRGLRSRGRRPRSSARCRRRGADGPARHRLALGHLRRRRLLARRNASPVRPAGRPDPADRRADRSRRRADRARVGGAGARRARTRFAHAAPRRARPARRVPAVVRSGDRPRRHHHHRRACASSRSGRRTIRSGRSTFAGGFDDRSHRRQGLGELMNRGYEDAYHQFIEPVVGASGERVGQLDRRASLEV